MSQEKVTIPELVRIHADTRVSDYGRMVTGFRLIFNDAAPKGIQPGEFAVSGNVTHPVLPEYSDGIRGVKTYREYMDLDVDPFLYDLGFRISLVKDGEVCLSFGAENVNDVSIETVDLYSCHTTEGGLNYRLFVPESEGPLPLVIWFHGNGERGTDNLKPMTANRGGVCFAEPDYQKRHACAVLVPQMNHSWSDDELAQTAEIARGLIEDGIVDGKRVYAVGLAAFQSTLRFVAHFPELVAGALPTIYWKDHDEDWTPLLNVPLWVSIAEHDITGEAPNLKEFVENMKAMGHKCIKASIYTDAEMMEYKLVGRMLHWGWTLTVNDPEMIDWLFAQSK